MVGPTHHQRLRGAERLKTLKPNLRERIVVKAPSVTDSFGEDSTTYDIVTGGSALPAQVLSSGGLSTLEAIEAGRPVGKETVTFIVRDDLVILGEYQITWRGFTWQVQGLPSPLGPRLRYQIFKAIRTDA